MASSSLTSGDYLKKTFVSCPWGSASARVTALGMLRLKVLDVRIGGDLLQ